MENYLGDIEKSCGSFFDEIKMAIDKLAEYVSISYQTDKYESYLNLVSDFEDDFYDIVNAELSDSQAKLISLYKEMGGYLYPNRLMGGEYEAERELMVAVAARAMSL